MSSRNIYIGIAIIIVVAIGFTETTKDNITVNNPQQITNNPQQKISNINNTFSDRLYSTNEDMRYIGRNFNSYNNDIDRREKQLAVFHCGVDIANSAWINHTYSARDCKNWKEKDWKEELPYSTQEFIKKNKNTPFNKIK